MLYTETLVYQHHIFQFIVLTDIQIVKERITSRVVPDLAYVYIRASRIPHRIIVYSDAPANHGDETSFCESFIEITCVIHIIKDS